MTTPETSTVPQQERVAGALGSFLFFVPILMEKKTEFTVLYMKQSFLLFVIDVALMIFTALFGFLYSIASLAEFVIFVVIIFLAWNAWQGKKFTVPGLLENSDKLIATLKITAWFTPGK